VKERTDHMDFLRKFIETEFKLASKDSKKKEDKEEFKFIFENKLDKEDENKDYRLDITYVRTDDEEHLEIKEDNEKKYSLEITKPAPDDLQNYAVELTYERTGDQERVEIKYTIPVEDYFEKEQLKKQDFTNRADKTLHIFPKSLMGGILGFTYLGENFMGRRDDLTGDKAFMVDVHEAIHTPDEYETRVLTDWMLTREKPRYKK